ncbi:C-terminal processing peptidase-3. Serine peptidase. MEROPS family S41A [Pseudoxanthomonas sp. GM95]|uniref:S41 family peptidase n=1 Tax=Pseudoxanthomonas sp. GM95 TaxID=1881043 RepID=UPI0008BAA14A|nr:S41 family peptidase [Pseudoxanthomonas sp. GM95]SEM13643.1 C-terminal processing peptidase-3. Serine peptidase. MEROPS family S41A [Pseudoxanthomonas sp. GM95]
MRVSLLLSSLLLAIAPAFAQQVAPPAQETPQQQAPQDPKAAPAAAPQDSEDEAKPVGSSDDPSASESTPSDVPLDEIRRFVSVFNAVKQAYVEPVDDEKLMHSAIRGLLLDLDPHSAYLDKEDAESFDEQANGAYDGIGVELLAQPDGSLQVVSPIDGTPAARAGVQSGDVIIAIDGKSLGGMKDSMEPLRGEVGSKVTLTIVREKVAKPFDKTLTRETIRVASVRSRLLEPGYGYIRISAFQADTGADFQKAVDGLKAKGALKGVVLDLRSNPGGLLTSAVQVADDLLEKGTIVTTKGRIAISDAKFDATPGDRLNGTPVVVLVDAGSASAAEVLAGALRDNGRVRIIGSRTFGKGSVQTVLPLDNGDSVKLTTARYYTPSGKSIQATGIVPDVVLKPDEPADKDVPASLADYSEATLPGHLLGDQEGAEGYTAGDVLNGDKPVDQALAELKHPGSVAAAQKAAADKAAANKPKPTVKPEAAAKPDAATNLDAATKPVAAPAKPAAAAPTAPASETAPKPEATTPPAK